MIRSRWRKMRGDEYCFNELKIRNNNPLFGDPTGDSALDEMWAPHSPHTPLLPSPVSLCRHQPRGSRLLLMWQRIVFEVGSGMFRWCQRFKTSTTLFTQHHQYRRPPPASTCSLTQHASAGHSWGERGNSCILTPCPPLPLPLLRCCRAGGSGDKWPVGGSRSDWGGRLLSGHFCWGTLCRGHAVTKTRECQSE